MIFMEVFPPLTALEYEDIVTDGAIGCAKDGLSKKKYTLILAYYWLYGKQHVKANKVQMDYVPNVFHVYLSESYAPT